VPVLEQGATGESRDQGHHNPYRWVMPAVSAGAVLVIGLLVVVGAYLVANGAETENLLALGYPGVSVVMFFSSATVLLPAPGFATLLAASGIAQLNPLVLGLFAGFGSSIGELTGYLVGIGGRKAFHTSENRWARRCEYFMRRWGFLTVLAMASIPNPFFDAVGIIAGSLGYPPARLWIACMIGNTFKYTALALLGGSAADMLFLHD
jgi:membrane protein YqaA with SNARE-associated domain